MPHGQVAVRQLCFCAQFLLSSAAYFCHSRREAYEEGMTLLSFRSCRGSLLLLLGWAASLLRGQQAPAPAAPPAATLKNLTLEELSQLEVTTPSRQPVRAFRTAAAIYVLTGEDIRRSGATNIPEALRLAPGVEVARIDGSKWSIGIRGFGTRLSRAVLVLIDGRTVYTPLFAGTYWEVQDTLLEDIDRIEVIRGPGGTIWGPNAVNGVINIITKPAKDTRGAYVSAGGGNKEQGFANFRYGGGRGTGLNYRFYGKGFTRGPEYHPDGRNFDDWRAEQTGFRLDWGVRAAGRVHGARRPLQGDGGGESDGRDIHGSLFEGSGRQCGSIRREFSGAVAKEVPRWGESAGAGLL